MSDSDPRQTTFVLRARRLKEPPRAGSYVASATGKSVYRVVSSRRLRTAGEPKAERLRLVCERVRAASVPEGAVVAPWPSDPSRPRRRPIAPVSSRGEPPTQVAIRKAKADARRAERERVAAIEVDADALVPPSLHATITGPDGEVLRGPRVRKSSWRDPEDRNRSTRVAKEIDGWRVSDPIEVAASKKGSLFTREHVLAADIYRQTYENGPGRSLPGWHLNDLARSAGYSSGSEPTERRRAAEMRWANLQKFIGDAKARSALAFIVIERHSVAAWGRLIGYNQKAAVGYLVAVLDRLVECFESQIDKEIRISKLEGASA